MYIQTPFGSILSSLCFPLFSFLSLRRKMNPKSVLVMITDFLFFIFIFTLVSHFPSLALYKVCRAAAGCHVVRVDYYAFFCFQVTFFFWTLRMRIHCFAGFSKKIRGSECLREPTRHFRCDKVTGVGQCRTAPVRDCVYFLLRWFAFLLCLSSQANRYSRRVCQR